MKKVVHMTSAHNSDDTRIFHNECVSLAKAGYDTFLVATGESREDQGVHVVGIGKQCISRLRRMTKIAKLIYKKSLDLDADIYHLHDPELLPYGLKLKKKGKKVIFDSHEDIPLTFELKKWIPKPIRKIIRFVFVEYEKKIIKKIDGAIVCYHWTFDRYKKYIDNVELVFNYPVISTQVNIEKDLNKENEIFTLCYAGNISEQWCHENILNALQGIENVRYKLAGIIDDDYLIKLKKNPGWSKVDFYGQLKFTEVKEQIYRKSSVGIALLDYIPQCKGNVGNLSNTKLFEYMQNGLPIIGTNFILWKKILDKFEFGVLVNPNSVDEITKAIIFLKENPKKVFEMGTNGQRAVYQEFNWEGEKEKLCKLYNNLV